MVGISHQPIRAATVRKRTRRTDHIRRRERSVRHRPSIGWLIDTLARAMAPAGEAL